MLFIFFKEVANIANRPLKLTEDVVAFGWPFGHNIFFDYVSATKGSVSGMAGFKDDTTEFRFTTPIHGGNSGGPVVALSDGRVVGLVSSGMEGVEYQNLNFAKYSSILRRMMNAKNVHVSDNKISEDEIVNHYIKSTKYISCIY